MHVTSCSQIWDVPIEWKPWWKFLSSITSNAYFSKTVKTDATGKLDFSIRYAKEYAQWLTATVRVTTKVDGSEFSQERDISLPVLDDDVITEDNKGIRPNTISPFGTLVSSTMLPYCSFSANN